MRRKIDIYTVPQFAGVLKQFETKDFKNLIIDALEVAPLQFWEMPASMRKGVHHESEHGIGSYFYDEEDELYVVESIGGKAFHTLRVLDVAEIKMEADDPRIMDWHGKVKETKFGNQMTNRERDLIRTACLLHDIYSGGTGDEFDSKRRSMDTFHPHYHKTELAHLSKYISADEWDLLIDCISQHMWKWDSNVEIIKFHDMENCKTVEEAYEFMRRYRIIKTVEESDLIASRTIRE